MYKVFLVEDEILVRNGIKQCINWEETEFEFCGEAADGELALSEIRQKCPDIVITDIKMPFLNGLQLSELIKKALPKTKIIIISGYDDFSYTKKAIEYGISDYLLKPIDAEDLLNALNNISKVIEKEKKQMKIQEDINFRIKNSKKVFRDIFLNELITGTVIVEDAIKTAEDLNLDIISGCYRVVIINCYPQTTEIRYILKTTLQTMCQQLETDKDCIPFSRTPESLVIIVKGYDSEDIENKVPDMLINIEQVLKEQKIEYLIGVGKTTGRLRGLEKSYRGACEALEYRYFFGQNLIVFEEDMRHFKEVYEIKEPTQVKQEKVYHFLQFGEIKNLDDFLTDYLKSIGADSLKSILQRYHIFMNLIDCCMIYVRDSEISADHNIMSLMKDMIVSIPNTESVEELLMQIYTIMSEIILLRNKLTNRYSMIHSKAIEYINRNFSDNQLSLSEVAAYVNMSPSYFSTIFRQEIGQTFREYLASIRINKACEMLKNTEKLASEIAFQVGYSDPHYFSVAFKKIVGVPPSEYRIKGIRFGSRVCQQEESYD